MAIDSYDLTKCGGEASCLHRDVGRTRLCLEPTSQVEDSAVPCDPSMLSKFDYHKGQLLAKVKTHIRPVGTAPLPVLVSELVWRLGEGEGHGCFYILHQSPVGSVGKAVLQEEGDTQVAGQVTQINPVTGGKRGCSDTLRTQSLKSKIHINSQVRRRSLWNS